MGIATCPSFLDPDASGKGASTRMSEAIRGLHLIASQSEAISASLSRWSPTKEYFRSLTPATRPMHG